MKLPTLGARKKETTTLKISSTTIVLKMRKPIPSQLIICNKEGCRLNWFRRVELEAFSHRLLSFRKSLILKYIVQGHPNFMLIPSIALHNGANSVVTLYRIKRFFRLEELCRSTGNN